MSEAVFPGIPVAGQTQRWCHPVVRNSRRTPGRPRSFRFEIDIQW